MGDRFEAIVGAEHVSRPEAQTLCGARVEAIVRPGSATEVAACLRAASRVAARARPGRRRLASSASAIRSSTGVHPARARAARRAGGLDPDEGVAEVDAGVPLESLAKQRRAPLGKTTCSTRCTPAATVGGAIAVDPVSPETSLDARLRNELLGLEVALANGELTHAGGRVVKNVTGFDLVRLYCGSFGALGVITRAIVRLRAAPERVAVTRARSLRRRPRSRRSREAPGPPTARRLVRGGPRRARSCAASPAAPPRSTAELRARRARRPTSTPGRELRAELACPPARGSARVRLGARPSDVAFLCRGLAAAAGEAALRLALPRAGIVFGRSRARPSRPSQPSRSAPGAAFALERAPGAEPLACDAFGAPPPALALMRALKARFDPARVLSPGRFVAGI